MSGPVAASGSPDAAVCPRCSSPLSTPVACSRCGALLTVPAGTDHFALLGLPRAYGVDEGKLERAYLKASRLVHPDYFGAAPRAEQEQAMRHAALLNDAYQTLKDPVRRSEYLLRLLGGKTSTQDRTTPPCFLAEMLELREECDDPELATARKTELLEQVGARIHALLAELPPLFARALAAPFAQRGGLLAALRSALNSYYYLETLRENLTGEKRLRR